MSEVAKSYDVEFIFYDEEIDTTERTRFTAYDPTDIKQIISALSAFHSGDAVECYIDGEKAVLECDWGLA